MKTLIRFATLVLFLLSVAPWTAHGQAARGVVWKIPSNPDRAEADLLQMRQLGIDAVRTELVADRALLRLADTLGIQLYQELPVSYLPASRLLDSLAGAGRLLQQALRQAAPHPSARHFGLAFNVDTRNPEACRYLEELTRFARDQSAEGTQFYYVTPFVEGDRCTDAVDFVLLDALGTPHPQRLLERWRAAHGDTPAGIAAVGTWVDPDGPRGLNAPRSAESQARYLEEALRSLLHDPETAPPYVVFVYRWQDALLQERTPAAEPESPHLRQYGLFTLEGAPRPSLDVVRGMYTGRQTLFAFDAGTRPERQAPWLILLGWGVFAGLALFYALSPRFRHMVPRYFLAHNFYQDAVREGRDVLLGASVLLLVALGVSAGSTAFVVLETLRTERAFTALFGWLPDALQGLLLALLSEPWTLVMLVGSLYALSVVIWATLISIFSRRRYPLSPGQTLILSIWPRWPLLLALAASMVIVTMPHAEALQGVLLLLGFWILVTLLAMMRTLYDFASVTRVSPVAIVLVGLLSPIVLLGLAAVLLATLAPSYLRFVVHLAGH